MDDVLLISRSFEQTSFGAAMMLTYTFAHSNNHAISRASQLFVNGNRLTDRDCRDFTVCTRYEVEVCAPTPISDRCCRPVWFPGNQDIDLGDSGSGDLSGSPDLRPNHFWTDAPVTAAPVTFSPTTQAPSTVSPTSLEPTSESPTRAPNTFPPTSPAPTTRIPTARRPTTRAPSTAAPTTHSPTTRNPTSPAPITEAPTTTAPTTADFLYVVPQ